jgi:hypothetical protein
MIFAKIDVSFPRHYRLLDVRPESLGLVRSDSDRTDTAASNRTPLDSHACIARAAALGVWTAVLCYTREHMLDGFCPLSAIREIATEGILDELVEQGLFARTGREGRTGAGLRDGAARPRATAAVFARAGFVDLGVVTEGEAPLSSEEQRPVRNRFYTRNRRALERLRRALEKGVHR